MAARVVAGRGQLSGPAGGRLCAAVQRLPASGADSRMVAVGRGWRMTQAPLDLSVAGKDPTDSAKAAIARATRRQRQGADPERSAWGTASAGSGKTTVLAYSVLHLLLAGARPERA